ncbi:MAG: hypothetical protein R2847_04975 [Bacteroidia bacterium]
MKKQLMVFSAVSGICAVGSQAAGAHQLKGMLSPEMMDAFKTVYYQFFHTLGCDGDCSNHDY